MEGLQQSQFRPDRPSALLTALQTAVFSLSVSNDADFILLTSSRHTVCCTNAAGFVPLIKQPCCRALIGDRAAAQFGLAKTAPI